MQWQLSVTIDDLRAILVSLVESPTLVNVKSKNGNTNEQLRVTTFDAEFEIASFEKINTNQTCDLSIYQIESLDFDRFLNYRGESARIFVID